MAWVNSMKNRKIFEQSGSFRLTMPVEWVRRNGIRNKDSLVTIEYDGMIVVFGRKINKEEEQSILDDLRVKMQIARML